MSANALIEYSYTGESKNREVWAEMAGSPDDVRRAAVSLVLDIREVDARAAVWINNKRYDPTKEDLDEHHARLVEVFKAEAQRRKSGWYDKDDEEPQDMEAEREEAQALVEDEDLADLPPLPEIRF